MDEFIEKAVQTLRKKYTQKMFKDKRDFFEALIKGLSSKEFYQIIQDTWKDRDFDYMDKTMDELYKKGVRLLTLTWNYENCLGSPNSRERTVMDSGLKRFGMEVVERMNDLGIMIDVSHLSDGGFRDCIRHSRVPVVASHSNARSLCPHPRNLSDEMLRAIGEKGGTVGVNFYSAFLRETDGGENRADAEDIVRHVRWMMNQAGEDAVALGTDFDGFARADLPKGIQDVRDMEKVWETMRRAGITPRQIDKIASGNIRRVIREIWR